MLYTLTDERRKSKRYQRFERITRKPEGKYTGVAS